MKIVYLVNLLFQNYYMLNFKQHHCFPIFKILILFFYFCTISSAFSQTDSLATKSYEELIGSYKKVINKNTTLALIYLQKANQLAEKERDTSKMIYVLYQKADIKSLRSENVSALQDLDKAIYLAEKITDNHSLFSFYNLKGIIASDMGEHLKALEAYMKSRAYAILDKNQLNELIASINIGFIKKMNHDYAETISIYKKSLEILKSMDFKPSYRKYYELHLYINLADTYLRMKELGSEPYIKEAEYYNDLGIKICSKTEDITNYNLLLTNEVIIHFEKKQHKESIKLATEIKELAIKLEDEALLGTAYFYIGKNYHAQEKHQEAIENLVKFYEITQKSEKKFSNERQLHGLLERSYSVLREIEKSKFHYKEHERLLEKERRESVKVVSEIHDQNDLPEKTKRLEEISKEFKAQETRKKWLYGISGLLIILLIGSIIFYKFKVKRIKKRVVEVLRKVKALEQEQEAQKVIPVSSISEKVTDEKAASILEKLKKFEDDKEYLSLDCSLSYVAEKLESNTSYISNVINNYKNKTFKAYITELRINTALIRLKNDEKLRSYTIQAIAEEFGFKRQETFSKAFKSQTGIYPSQYLKKLREDLEID